MLMETLIFSAKLTTLEKEQEMGLNMHLNILRIKIVNPNSLQFKVR